MENPISANEKLEILGLGRTASVFALDTKKVLKLYQPWISAAPVNSEYQVTLAAHQAGLPVPFPYEVVKQGDRFGIVFERIYGDSLLKSVKKKASEFLSLAATLAKLHVSVNQTVAPTGLISQQELILKNIDRAEDLSAHKKELVRKHLVKLPQGNYLCHGDFHPENVLITENGPVLIDWMTGSAGSPVGDLARSLMILQTSAIPPHLPKINQWMMQFFRSRLVAGYKREYLKLIPVSEELLSAWELPILAGRLMEVSAFPQEKENILNRIDILLADEV